MAKKAKELSVEEKLEQTLVPVEEQPYEVPENWCWVYAPSIFDIEYGKGLSTKDLLDEGYPVFGANGQMGYYSEYMYEEKQALMSCRGAYSGTMNQSLPTSYVTSNSLIIQNKYMNSSYICYLFTALNTDSLISGSAQPQVTVQAFSKFPIPLPTLNEQNRIVNKIESMFVKLDEAKEIAEDVIGNFDNIKDSILHEAFSGSYTINWREKNGITVWQKSKLGDYLYPMKTKKPESETFRYIDIDSIDNKKQCVSEPKTIYSTDAPSRASRAVHENDVLFSMVRPYLKNIAFIEKELSDCIASTGFYVCSCKKGLNSRYLYEFLRSKDALDYLMQFMKGDNSPSIRKDDLLDMEIKIPSIEEQEEIVNVLNSILAKHQRIKQLAEDIIESIDMIKKSILAKAFRGELGTNIESEESSIELLKEILKEEK